jgi:hypothetical protein
VAEAADDHVFVQPGVQFGHAIRLHISPNDELVCRPEKQEPHDHANWGDHKGIDQARSRRDRHDVAVPDGGHGDHREVDDVVKGEVAVELVPEPSPVQPENEDHQTQQREDQGEPKQQRPTGSQIRWRKENPRRRQPWRPGRHHEDVTLACMIHEDS